MRKTQQKIIDTAVKRKLPQNIIDFLSDESYELKTLFKMLYYFSEHYRCSDEIEEPGVFFQVKAFVNSIRSNGVDDDKWMWYIPEYAYTLPIKEVLYLKEQYDNGDISAYDAEQIICILKYIKEYPYKYSEEEFKKEMEFYEKRKSFLEPFHDATNHRYDNLKILKISMENLYGKYQSISLDEKMQIEKEVFESGNLLDFELSVNSVYWTIAVEHMSKPLTPIFDIISEMAHNAECNFEDNDKYNFYFMQCPDTRTMEFFDSVLSSDVMKSDSDYYRELRLQAVPPKPYDITVRTSATGIGIEYKDFNTYKLMPDGNVTLVDQNFYAGVLFTYDLHCFYRSNSSKRWIPASLPQIVKLYRIDFWRQIFDVYFDIVSENAGLFKDLKRSLHGGSGMPPLIINDILPFRTKKDMMLSTYKNSNIINWNRKDLYVGYLTMKALPSIKEEDRNILIDYVNRHDFTMPQDDIDENVNNLIYKVIADRLEGFNPEYSIEGYEDEDMIFDYILISRKIHSKISLKFHSRNSLYEAHDEVVNLDRNSRIVKVKIPKNSKFLPLRKVLPDDFEWIKTARRLSKEGRQQHNCVTFYDADINKDLCAIYSLVRNNERYTIEFAYNEHSRKYHIQQVRGVCNSACPVEVKKYIESFINDSSVS